MPRSDARQDLLDAVVAFASGHGVSDLSLRQLAQAIGTSHRMLIYHFGSKEGLLVAIVGANERAQRDTAAEMLADAGGDPDDVLRRLWDRLSDPGMWPSERLFFELYCQALQGRPGTTDFLDGIVTSWIEPATALLHAQGLEPDDARSSARLDLAVVRGLLLDLLATGDRAGTDRAMDMFLRRRTATGPPQPTPLSAD